MDTPEAIKRPRGFYPKGFRPGWWRCPVCRDYWHDSWQEQPESTSWEMPPECFCYGRQEMVRSDPPPSQQAASG